MIFFVAVLVLHTFAIRQKCVKKEEKIFWMIERMVVSC